MDGTGPSGTNGTNLLLSGSDATGLAMVDAIDNDGTGNTANNGTFGDQQPLIDLSANLPA